MYRQWFKFTKFSTAFIIALALGLNAQATSLAPNLAMPTNGAVNQPIVLTLSWGSSTGAVSYEVQVSLSSNFGITIFNQPGETLTSTSVSGLVNANTYYWRANATDGIGDTSWSNAWSFTTITAPPAAPILVSPSSGATNEPISVGLTWNTLAGATAYQVEVSLSTTFGTTLFDETGDSTSGTSISGLFNATTYYWRANGVNLGGIGAWSSAWSFTTIIAPPKPPMLSSPPNGATYQSISSTLSWNTIAGAVSYGVSVSSSINFATTVLSQTGLTGLFISLSGLANSTPYYWEVNATNLGGSSVWSGAWSFTTIIAAPSAPSLSMPLNGATSQPTTLTLSWNSVNGTGTYYTVQVSTGSTFSGSVFSQSGTSLTAVVSGLSYGGKNYYWQVNASDAGGTTWSGVWSFVTLAYVAPILSSPTNGSTNLTFPLTLSWASCPGATSYFLLGSIGTSLSESDIYQDSPATSAVASLNGNIAIMYGKTYAWGVLPQIAAGNAVWSSIWTFSTLSVPAAPSLASPTNGAIFVPNEPLNLSWGTVANGNFYLVQVSTSSYFSSIIMSLSGPTAPAQFTPAHGIRYYWEVCATDTAGTGAWSSVWEISPSVSLAASHQLWKAGSFSIKSGLIAYSLPTEEHVELSVCDIVGKTVMIFSKRQAAGSYSIDLKESDLAAGLYIVRFKAGAIDKESTIILKQ